MRSRSIRWALPALLIASSALAQTPGSFIGASQGNTAPLTAAALNAAFAAEMDYPGPPTGRLANCTGDGVHDDTVCVQAALNAGGLVYLGKHIYAINIAGLFCTVPVNVVGTQGNQTRNYGTVSGFRPLVENETLLTISTGCTGSIFEKFSMDMGAQGANTSGDAIAMIPTLNNVTLSDLAINAPCIGVDLNGNTIKADRIQITQVAGVGCGAMRIGHLTTNGGTTDPRVTNSTFQSVQTGSGTPASFGMKIEDAGGLFMQNNDILYSDVGTWIIPGINQQVADSFFDNTVFGDTTVHSPLVIDTADASAIVSSVSAHNSWAAAYTSTTTAPGILIQNTSGSANFKGFHFVGQRVFSVPGNGVSLLAGTDFSFDASRICGAGLNTGVSTYVGIELGSGLHGLAVRNSTINSQCDNSSSGHHNYNLKLDGGNYGLILSGNNLDGWTTAATNGQPIQNGSTGSNIVHDNLGIDDQIPSLTAATSTDIGMFPIVQISGATAITTITGCWAGHQIIILPGNSLTFSTGGNIFAAYSGTTNIPITAICAGTSPPHWFLK